MKYKFVFAMIFLFLFSITFISAAGVCALDKTNYAPGESALFSCVCTSPQEEGATGNIVWRNSTNAILQNTSTNSGLCRTSLFGDTFLFPTGSNFTGNATFETADVDWIGDIISDDFNVSGAGIFDCIINGIILLEPFQIGGEGAMKMDVSDGITGGGLVHASCSSQLLDINEIPLAFEPDGATGSDSNLRQSTSDGHIDFTHDMVENFWETNTTYIAEFHCLSLPNDTFADLQHISWDQSTGRPAGFKVCTAQRLFTTSLTDLRPEQTSTGQGLVILGTFLALIVGIIILVGLGAYIKWMPFKIFLISLGSLLLMFTIGYAASLDSVLGTNGIQGDSIGMLYVLGTIVILGGLIGLVILLIVLGINFFRFRRGISTSFFGKDEDN